MAHVDMSTLLPNTESQCAWGVCKLKALQAMVKITALLWFRLFSFCQRYFLCCLLPEQSHTSTAMAVSCRALAALPGELKGA